MREPPERRRVRCGVLYAWWLDVGRCTRARAQAAQWLLLALGRFRVDMGGRLMAAHWRWGGLRADMGRA
eukprot:5335839-Prymnesium_polylepis.1